MANYFQTDDRDDYFASLSKDKKPRLPKPTFNIYFGGKLLVKNAESYKGITFTKTIVNKTRKQLQDNRWILELIYKEYFVEANCERGNRIIINLHKITTPS